MDVKVAASSENLFSVGLKSATTWVATAAPVPTAAEAAAVRPRPTAVPIPNVKKQQ